MATEHLAPLLEPWTGPYGGVPPFSQVEPETFAEAFEVAIAEAEAEIEAIATSNEEPTFHNTVTALERAGQTLRRVGAVFGVHAGNLNVGPLPDLQRTIRPLLAAHSDRVVQNQALFDRIQAVWRDHQTGQDQNGQNGQNQEPADPALDGPSQRLLEQTHQYFVRQGAALSPADKATLAGLNQQLAGLYTDFGQNVLDDEANQVTWIEDQAELAGLPDSVVQALAAAATELGRPEAWAVANTRSAMDPVLTQAESRDLRERVWQTYYSRGQGLTAKDGDGGGGDNRPIITEILALRAERARLLGYPSHAHWQLEKEMARTPESAMELMLQVWPPALERAAEEVAAMADLAGQPIEAWDYRFWAEKVRRRDYAVDAAELEPYLQLESLIEAMHWCANQLYGLEFVPVESGADPIPVFHDDVRVWEVKAAPESGPAHIALWYLDPYARPGKLSGAWMTQYRPQHRLDQTVTTLVSNNSNFVKPGSADDPVIVSWDDARTLFHEFGHALHGILSDVTYPSQSGTAVCRDYVEFPSQLNEHWLATPEVMSQFCLHHETGQPMPDDLIKRIGRAESFNQGFETIEYLASALYDMRIHLAAGDGTSDAPAAIEPLEFEAALMTELGLPTQIVMRHRPTQFNHIFSGDGYSAAYYSYLWADALTADAAEAFTEGNGLFDTDVAERLRRDVLSVGDTVDPAEGFRAFRGRDVDTGALLRKRGFAA